jgi:hypothetical protein
LNELMVDFTAKLPEPIKDLYGVFIKSCDQAYDNYFERYEIIIRKWHEICPGGSLPMDKGSAERMLQNCIDFNLKASPKTRSNLPFLSENNFLYQVLGQICGAFASTAAYFEVIEEADFKQAHAKLIESMESGRWKPISFEAQLYYAPPPMNIAAVLDNLNVLKGSAALLPWNSLLPLLSICHEEIANIPEKSIIDRTQLEKIDEIDQENLGRTWIDEEELKKEAEGKEVTSIEGTVSLTRTLNISPLSYKHPFQAFIQRLKRIYGISKEIILPIDLQGTKQSLHTVLKFDQIHSNHCMQLFLEMLKNCKLKVIQDPLMSLFSFWGHNAIENGMLSQYCRLKPGSTLSHPLTELGKALNLPKTSLWLQYADRESFYLRYPYSFEPKEDKEFPFLDWVTQALQIQIFCISKYEPKHSEDDTKALEEILERSKKEQFSVGLPDKEAHIPLAEAHLKEIQIKGGNLANYVYRLSVYIDDLNSKTPGSELVKRLKNVWHHLSMLSIIGALIERFPQSHYWLIHAQGMLFCTQHLAENLGAYLALSNYSELSTHDLNLYMILHKLGEPLNAEARIYLRLLNVDRGSQNPYMYFWKTAKKDASPFMNFINELTVLSQTQILMRESGKTIQYPIEKLSSLQEELVNNYSSLSELAGGLIEGHIFNPQKS